MSDHTQNIFKAFKDLEFKDTVSHECGVTLNDSVEARAIAELMSTKPGLTVTYMPAMIRIDGNGKIEFKMDEIAAELGREMTVGVMKSFCDAAACITKPLRKSSPTNGSKTMLMAKYCSM